jgi:hypothetical protein
MRFWYPHKAIGRVKAVHCKITHCPIKALQQAQFKLKYAPFINIKVLLSKLNCLDFLMLKGQSHNKVCLCKFCGGRLCNGAVCSNTLQIRETILHRDLPIKKKKKKKQKANLSLDRNYHRKSFIISYTFLLDFPFNSSIGRFVIL